MKNNIIKSIKEITTDEFNTYLTKLKVKDRINDFEVVDNIKLFKEHYPTGFAMLDSKLGGGFVEGLHILGAISSLGKSTFALQIAANIAKTNRPVIFVSLEMEKDRLLAKLISSEMYQIRGKNEANCKTANQILSKDRLNFRAEDWEKYYEALEIIDLYSDNLIILENQIDPITIDNIETFVNKFIEVTKIKPFVIIDYLQILSVSNNQFSSERSLAEAKVIELRKLALKNRIPVLVISSLNRENYNTKANMSAFKETGLIEYSADSLIGLQFSGVGASNFDVEEAKSKYPRNIELKILKNRYGETGVTVNYAYFTKFDYFYEELDSPEKVELTI